MEWTATGFWITFFVRLGLAQNGCPSPWLFYSPSCYLFYQDTHLDHQGVLAICSKYGAGLVSINSQGEHDFVSTQIRQRDSAGYHWYTSGKDDRSGRIKWQGDGSDVSMNVTYWLTYQDRLLNYSRIIYKTDGSRYGLSKSVSSVELPFVCEISQLESYRIAQGERDFTYGTNLTDAREAPRGPKFLLHPKNIVVVNDARSDMPDEHMTITLECFADGNPMPTYQMLQTGVNGSRIIDATTDSRYILTGGSLTIVDPDQSTDSGMFQCMATNTFGTVFSDLANVTFGVLEQFSNVQRAPVMAEEYRSTAIECSPPPFRPAVSYQWYRGQFDFVRPDLNPYMFISSNGKLYFSEVTQNDEGDYHCIVKLTGGGQPMSTGQPPSRVSTPIPLHILHQVPATWGPEIADGFIASFPNRPLHGNTVKLECLAYGTLPMVYEWSRKDYPLPASSVLSDHNRILEIFEVNIEDAGVYYCTVRRNTGETAQAIHTLNIENAPFFISELPDLHADEGSRVTWRCEVKAVPQAVYNWYKDGIPLDASAPGIHIVSNVVTFTSLQASHAGMYQCAAINTHGMAYSSAQLRVLAFPPTFAKKPLVASLSAALRGHVTIQCSPEAAPLPEYTWTRNGANVGASIGDSTARVQLLANGDLSINPVQAGDAGQYCCQATNMFGSAISCGQLHVVQNSVMLLSPTPTIGRFNTTSVLLCEASFPSHADNIYLWQFNGHPIDPKTHRHYTLGSPERPGALYVTSAQYSQAGIYTCIAKTAYDSVNASAYLTVNGPPGAPAGVFVIPSTISNTTATVVWTEGVAHGPPVDFHNIEACTEHNSTWVPVATGVPVTSTIITGRDRHAFTLNHLKPGNSYYFRVRGINSYGIGQASKGSVAYHLPGSAPTVYPTNVGGGGGVVGVLEITWDFLAPEDQGAPGVGYIVYWRLSNSTRAFTEKDVGNINHYTVTVGIDYYYLLYEVKVRAYNDIGHGPLSPDKVYAYSAEAIPKGVPTNIYAYPYNATAIKVSWQVVPNDREHMGGTLMGYQVNYKIRFDPDAGWEAISWRGETHDGVVIGLDPYFWYSVDIQILNTAGMGPRSEIYHSRTFKEAPRLYPVEVQVFSHTSESVRVTWRGVSTSVDEENIEGYVVRYWQTTDDVRSATDVKTERAAVESLLYGIRKDVVYECRVFGFSRGGDGKHSQSVLFTLGGQLRFDPSSSEIMSSASYLAGNTKVILATLWTLVVAIFAMEV